ncbi:class I SAM-dependent methyltransferase [Sorangium sp. So ce693]|uniref:class I SAM-dependent methyltransferase n=1 Tax=Sorangium sp. So ce693 TaxID=3133318 RepID=UPI003F60F249
MRLKIVRPACLGSGLELSRRHVMAVSVNLPDERILAAPHSSCLVSSEHMPFRNVYACLVHEDRESVIDLIRNLHYLDPASAILLYNGGTNRKLLGDDFPFEQYGAMVHPAPRPMKWGYLHGFAVDCMRFALESLPFDAMTIVDSDQLATRPGYSGHLEAFLASRPRVGLLGNSPAPQGPVPTMPPAIAARREIDLWRRFLRRFPDGEAKFVHWTFWPSTVITAAAAREIVSLFHDVELQAILQRSRMWATEEVLFPTLTALLGYEVAENPCSYEYVKFRVQYSVAQLNTAFADPRVYWVHPIPRRSQDPLRRHIRARFGNYGEPAAALPPANAAAERAGKNGPAPPPGPEALSWAQSAPRDRRDVLLATRVLGEMRPIEGWLSDDEADLLIAAAGRALYEFSATHAMVEIGSYCGKATLVLGRTAQAIQPEARLFAIDPHDGRVGARDTGLSVTSPTRARFDFTVAAAGLGEQVVAIEKRAPEVAWQGPVSLLLVDGLHDYESVREDFEHFERWIAPFGYVAFHDHAGYFPGVIQVVDELCASGSYRRIGAVGTMVVLQKAQPAGEAPRLLLRCPILAEMKAIEGWLSEEEADLVITAAARALEELPASHAMVEIGSYCGKATVVLGRVVQALRPEARIYAIDPHDGRVGARDWRIVSTPPTRLKFDRTIAHAELGAYIVPLQRRAPEVAWAGPVSLLLVDGLHDEASVRSDFAHFDPWVVEGGYVLFHDYGGGYPGVTRVVDAILCAGAYVQVHAEGSMILLKKRAAPLEAGPLAARGVGSEAPAPALHAPPLPAPPLRIELSEQPLVTAIMPTADRRRFIPHAIRHFQKQDYPNRELVIVDDGADPVNDIVPDDPCIRYLRLPSRRTVGWKRNYACREARGEVIIHWDDDDWMADNRIRYQVERLLAERAALSGLSRILYYQPASGKTWQFVYGGGPSRWFGGNTLCYRKALWAKNPFPDINVGEDARFVWSDRASPMTALEDDSFIVGIIHSANVSPKRVGNNAFRPLAPERIRTVMGDDFEAYRALLASERSQ